LEMLRPKERGRASNQAEKKYKKGNPILQKSFAAQGTTYLATTSRKSDQECFGNSEKKEETTSPPMKGAVNTNKGKKGKLGAEAGRCLGEGGKGGVYVFSGTRARGCGVSAKIMGEP